MNAFGFPFYAANPFGMSSSGSSSVTGDVPEYSDTSGLVLQDSGFKMSDKLSTDGSNMMLGDLDMNGNILDNYSGIEPDVTDTRDIGSSLKRNRDVYMSGSLKSATSTKSIEDIVTSASLSVANNLASFQDTSGKIIIDSGLDVGDVVFNVGASTTDNVAVFADTSGKEIKDSGINLGSKLNIDGSIAMTGDFNMGNFNIIESNSIYPSVDNTSDIGLSFKRFKKAFFADDITALSFRTVDTNVTVGTAATSGSLQNVTIGLSASTLGQVGVAIGYLATADNQGTAVGRETSAAEFDSVFGQLSTSTGEGYSVVVGADSHGTAPAAHIFGSGATNATTRSILLSANGASTLLNVRSKDDGVTDLGTTGSGFNILYCNGVDRNAGVLNLGTSTATGVTLAAATIPTIIRGKGYVGTTRPIMSGGYVQTTNVTIANTTTETSFIGSGLGSLTSLANTMSVGNVSKMEASGTIGINVGAQTITLRLYGGASSTTLLATNVIVVATLTASAAWKLITASTVKSLGASGTVQLNSTFTVNDLTPSQAYVNQTLATIDTTVNNVFYLTAQWSAANAANTITSSQFFTHSVYVV